MKFKSNQEDQNKELEISENLKSGFLDLIQFEIDKLTLLNSACYYFYKLGLTDYKKFCKHLLKACEDTKHCLIWQVMKNSILIPELTIPKQVEFADKIEPFKLLASMEETYVEKVTKLIDIAMEDKNWNNFNYLLDKLKAVDYICSRALSAVENNANILALCEPHIMEK